MKNERLPKIALNKLVQMKDVNSNYDWFGKISKIFKKYGCRLNGNLEEIIENKEKLIFELENKMIEDWRKFLETENMIIGKSLLCQSSEKQY